MKKTTKIIVTGAVCAALTATSFAAGTLVNIAVDPSIKILVNGEEFKPKDVNGNDVMVLHMREQHMPLSELWQKPTDLKSDMTQTVKWLP